MIDQTRESLAGSFPDGFVWGAATAAYQIEGAAREDGRGWPSRATAGAFAEFADAVSRRLGDRVRHWITLNEPWCSAFLGYYRGEHAPGRTSLADALAAGHTLLLAHGMAVPILRQNSPGARVGITLNPEPIYAASEAEADRAAAPRWHGSYNRWFSD